ncbi:MAG: NAD-dependent deacylase [Niastella sp.]|nr:NAD-dependent deacylase [Niastella sp.]
MKHIVVLTGAGISAESGLKTFRDDDGLWMGYRVEDVATLEAFYKDPAMVLDFYNMRRRDVSNALPNAAHLGLALLEKEYKVSIITQNVDDLHERAGSSRVLHLHGEIFKMHSIGNPGTVLEIKDDINPGDKGDDGTQLRPHIVWFGEAVPMMEQAILLLAQCDYFVIVGTSLQVYPAASLLSFIEPGTPVFIIDKKIPDITHDRSFTIIEKVATEGVADLLAILKK